jgi:hypothetical protein
MGPRVRGDDVERIVIACDKREAFAHGSETTHNVVPANAGTHNHWH